MSKIALFFLGNQKNVEAETQWGSYMVYPSALRASDPQGPLHEFEISTGILII